MNAPYRVRTLRTLEAVNTPMTPAQAAQQSNRDDGGRYAAKAHAEADIALTAQAQPQDPTIERIAATAPRYDLYGREDVSAIVATEAFRRGFPDQGDAELDAIIDDAAAGQASMDTALEVDGDRYLDVAHCATRDADGTWRISYHSGGYGADWSDTQITWSAEEGLRDTGAGAQERLESESYGFAGGAGDFMQAAFEVEKGREAEVFEAMEARYQQVATARSSADTWGTLGEQDYRSVREGMSLAAEVARDRLDSSDFKEDYQDPQDRQELDQVSLLAEEDPDTLSRDDLDAVLGYAVAELDDRAGKERSGDYDWKEQAGFKSQARRLDRLRGTLRSRPEGLGRI